MFYLAFLRVLEAQTQAYLAYLHHVTNMHIEAMSPRREQNTREARALEEGLLRAYASDEHRLELRRFRRELRNVDPSEFRTGEE
jgi:hypothetical protein